MRTAELRKERDSGWSVVDRSKKEGRIIPWSRAAVRSKMWGEPKPRPVKPLASKLLTVIERSRAILDLPVGWDDAGNPPFESETWERMRYFLESHAAIVWQRTGLAIPVPRILPGPDGSIDLHWKTTKRELLVNIPEDPGRTLTYYGDDFGEDQTEGNIEPGALNPGLFTWLTVTD